MDTLGGGIASLQAWSRGARLTIGLFLIVVALLIVANGLILIAELSSGPGFGIYSRVVATSLFGTNLLLGLFFAISAVPVAGWIYRAHANLREAGVAELRYSPGWSVGSFLVPLVNLAVPFWA